MGYEKIIRSHYDDLNSLNALLKNYTDVYRLLVSSTAELNTINFTKKGEIKASLDRISKVGDLIDELLKVIHKCEGAYVKYCYLKNEVINQKVGKDDIKTEIHDDLEFHN